MCSMIRRYVDTWNNTKQSEGEIKDTLVVISQIYESLFYHVDKKVTTDV